MISLRNMVELISGLQDTPDLTDWENGFVTGIIERYESAKKDTRFITSAQIDIIERIYKKHFA